MRPRTVLVALLLLLALFTAKMLLHQFSYQHRDDEGGASSELVVPGLRSGGGRGARDNDGHRLVSSAVARMPAAPDATQPRFRRSLARQSAAPFEGAPAPGGPAAAPVNKRLPYSVEIQEIGPGFYEVSAADAQALFGDAGRWLPAVARGIRPAFSLDGGPQYRVRSEFSDGVLTSRGFTVTDPKLAQQAGIEAGDIILSVNQRPVDGLASTYAIFLEVTADPTQSTVAVELDRRGTRLTKTYSFR